MKASYFKLHNSDISVNPARTRQERDRLRTLKKSKTDGSCTEEGDKNSESNTDKNWRSGRSPQQEQKSPYDRVEKNSPPILGYNESGLPVACTNGGLIKKRRLIRKYK